MRSLGFFLYFEEMLQLFLEDEEPQIQERAQHALDGALSACKVCYLTYSFSAVYVLRRCS